MSIIAEVAFFVVFGSIISGGINIWKNRNIVRPPNIPGVCGSIGPEQTGGLPITRVHGPMTISSALSTNNTELFEWIDNNPTDTNSIYLKRELEKQRNEIKKDDEDIKEGR
jgi:hypothetical protein